MRYNIRIVSTYPPRQCGIATFSRNLTEALRHFTSEVDQVTVAAIDKDKLAYESPVDIVIDQYNPPSWHKAGEQIVTRAKKQPNPTVVLLQHEYGLDPDAHGNDAQGTNFIELAKKLRTVGLETLAYLHTVLSEPNDHQRRVLQELAAITDGVLVPTESAVDILESPVYGIERSRIKHIDHGIRMRNPSEYDRLVIKREYGFEGKLLVTTLGLHSPGKGLQYGIRAYGRFVEESCSESQRANIVYLIAGPCHPEFVKAQGGELYREYEASLKKALENARLKWCKVKRLGEADSICCDVVFLDTFMDETTLMKLYGATNVMVLPYLNTEQISSGILADTVGAGRVAIATKFRYAVELLNPGAKQKPGLVIGSHARGALVDPGEPSIEQIAQALDYVVFNRERRLAMEKRAHRKGYQMKWENCVWAMLQYIQFVREQQDIVTGRGIEFNREKRSIYQKKIARVMIGRQRL